MDKKKRITRRDFLKIGGVTGAGALLTACSVAQTNTPTATAVPMPTETSIPLPTVTPETQPVLRIAHISDMHIDLSQKANEHFRRAIRNITQHAPAFDVVFNTGDCVMDAMWAGLDDANAQWDVFTSVMEGCSLPVYHAIGNHDVWGWGNSEEVRQTLQTDPLYGKGLAVQRLGLTNRYYTFDKNGWRFFVLDSTHLADQSFFQPYTGKLDDEQYEWLAAELAATPAETPVCILSHIPILGANGLLDGDNEKSGDWLLPGAWVHIDARRLWKLFWQYPNVKICLSGHSHQVEDLKYHGVNYLNNGAISGNWWNGAYFDFPPGYMSVSLYMDGSVTTEFIEY
ncbi:MAG: twin-arginine translocation signal domain-containing protein [Chloroflexi bacterium]|nr:MAG: twin-arginine translocation signal domain-containing protein [Chloroflexota bacterium]